MKQGSVPRGYKYNLHHISKQLSLSLENSYHYHLQATIVITCKQLSFTNKASDYRYRLQTVIIITCKQLSFTHKANNYHYRLPAKLTVIIIVYQQS